MVDRKKDTLALDIKWRNTELDAVVERSRYNVWCGWVWLMFHHEEQSDKWWNFDQINHRMRCLERSTMTSSLFSFCCDEIYMHQTKNQYFIHKYKSYSPLFSMYPFLFLLEQCGSRLDWLTLESSKYLAFEDRQPRFFLDLPWRQPTRRLDWEVWLLLAENGRIESLVKLALCWQYLSFSFSLLSYAKKKQENIGRYPHSRFSLHCYSYHSLLIEVAKSWLIFVLHPQLTFSLISTAISPRLSE